MVRLCIVKRYIGVSNMRLYEIREFFEAHQIAEDHPLVGWYHTVAVDRDENAELSGEDIEDIITCFRMHWDSIKVTGPGCILLYETNMVAWVFYNFAAQFFSNVCFDHVANRVNIFGNKQQTIFGLLIPSLCNYSDSVIGCFLEEYSVPQLIYAPIENGDEYVTTEDELTQTILQYGRVVHPYCTSDALDLTVFGYYWKQLNETDKGRIILKLTEQLSFSPSKAFVETLHVYVKEHLVSVIDQKILIRDNGEALFREALIQGVNNFIRAVNTLGPDISKLKYFPVGSRTFVDVIDLLTSLVTNNLTVKDSGDICWGELIIILDHALKGLKNIYNYLDYCEQRIAASSLGSHGFMSFPLRGAVVNEGSLQDDSDHALVSYA